MDDLFFGDGWLGDLLKQARVPVGVKDRVRNKIQAMTAAGEDRWEKEWGKVRESLARGKVGEALETAMGSFWSTREVLEEVLGEEKAFLEKPFSPFMIRSHETRKIIQHREDLKDLVISDDDLDKVIGLEMINSARRLLASWGTRVWGAEPLEIIKHLEKDLEDMRKSQAGFQEIGSLEEEDIEKEIEQADRFATMATSFARDLFELHLLNAANPEVKMRFQLLWGTVRQLREDGEIPAAAFEALQVLEEALHLAGLGGGDLLQRVDLLYDVFTGAEELRRAADRLVSQPRDEDGEIQSEEGLAYIDIMESALGDIGLQVG
jgi:hypothetical protein